MAKVWRCANCKTTFGDPPGKGGVAEGWRSGTCPACNRPSQFREVEDPMGPTWRPRDRVSPLRKGGA